MLNSNQPTYLDTYQLTYGPRLHAALCVTILETCPQITSGAGRGHHHSIL